MKIIHKVTSMVVIHYWKRMTSKSVCQGIRSVKDLDLDNSLANH